MISPKITNLGYSNLWTDMSTILGYQPTFDQRIQKLFANGEQGFFYDPNDLSTMYQDAAGNVPVTAVGQPVGLLLDKSKGMVLGSNLVKPDADVVSGGVEKVGDATYRIVSTGEIQSFSYSDIPAGAIEIDYEILQVGAGTIRIDSSVVTHNVSSQVGRRKVILYKTRSTVVFVRNTTPTDVTIKVHSIRQVLGNHAYQTTSAARPILRKNAVTGANYLEFDGSDDFLQTNNIDFTATDKVSLFAGVRKSSDAVLGYLLNLGDYETQQGVFHVRAPQANAEAQVALYAKGTIGRPAIAMSVPSGINFVLSGSAAVSTSEVKLKINAILAASNNFGLGTGNFGNYPLYVGRFNGVTLPFNGHLYSLIGIGRLTTDNETKELEKALAKIIEVTLNV